MGSDEPLVFRDLEINGGGATATATVRFGLVRDLWGNLLKAVFGTKLAVLFPAIPLAVAADFYNFGSAWTLGLSLLGLAHLAERVSFLTDWRASECNMWECNRVDISNVSITPKQNPHLEILPFGFHSFQFTSSSWHLSSLWRLIQSQQATNIQPKSRERKLFSVATRIAMPNAAIDIKEEEDDEEMAIIGVWSSFGWLVGMTIVIAVLSQYVVATIEEASQSWGVSVSFMSIIVLPIMGNAAEHAGSVIFAVKNKLDITLGIALGSAAQISVFVVPLSVAVGWCSGIKMDLDFGLIETASLAFAIVLTLFTLQVTSI
ncbi:Vacuolar cation/proton exchanger 3, partial [Cucurbita argyrosperma subsp. sororia]